MYTGEIFINTSMRFQIVDVYGVNRRLILEHVLYHRHLKVKIKRPAKKQVQKQVQKQTQR